MTVSTKSLLKNLAGLAFGDANDCVKLVTQENPKVKNLDLRLLTEIKRGEKGTISVKLLDRLDAIRLLSEILKCSASEESAALDAIAGVL